MAHEIVLSEIKNKEDLKKIVKFLEEQGFNLRESSYSLNNDKITKIIINSNKLNLEIDGNEREKLFTQLSKIENYSDMITTADAYFSRFSSDDKIYEVLQWFYIQADEQGSVPSHYSPSPKEIVEWFNFKTKYNINDNDFYDSVSYYNFDKNILKISFSDTKSWEFDKIYKLIFGEDIKPYRKNSTGDWQDLGKIQIKFFLKGSANIKGDLTILKEYLYKKLIKRIYNNYIIKYNGKTEVFKKTKE